MAPILRLRLTVESKKLKYKLKPSKNKSLEYKSACLKTKILLCKWQTCLFAVHWLNWLSYKFPTDPTTNTWKNKNAQKRTENIGVSNNTFIFDISFFSKGSLSNLREFLARKGPLEIMKNTFYFTLKALFVLKIFHFLSWLIGHVENGLIRKIRVISKFVMSQSGWQTIAIHILTNISRGKRNQITIFGQSIKYNIRIIFLETSSTKCGRETSPRLFSKKSKLSISPDQ